MVLSAALFKPGGEEFFRDTNYGIATLLNPNTSKDALADTGSNIHRYEL